MQINPFNRVPGQGTYPYCSDIITPQGQQLPINALGQYSQVNPTDASSKVSELKELALRLDQIASSPSAVVNISPQALQMLAQEINNL
jgi:hypothetical protein